MKFILWTCGWFLTVSIGEYLSFLQEHAQGIVYPPQVEAVSGLLMIGVWVMGMIKFWKE